MFSNLTIVENKIINLIWSFEFPYKEILAEQIKKSEIKREIYSNYYKLKFFLDCEALKLPRNVIRCPVCISILSDVRNPIVLLVLIQSGLIEEIVVFSADLSGFELDEVLEGRAEFELEYNVKKIKQIITERRTEVLKVIPEVYNDDYVRCSIYMRLDSGGTCCLEANGCKLYDHNVQNIADLSLQEDKGMYVVKSKNKIIIACQSLVLRYNCEA